MSLDIPRTARLHDSGSREGFLFNYHPVTVGLDGGIRGEGDAAKRGTAPKQDTKEQAIGSSALQLFFYDANGEIFECPIRYAPYFLVAAEGGREREVELGITGAFGAFVRTVEQIEKEDLEMHNHLSGKTKIYIKISFHNTSDLTAVRQRIETALRRNQSRMKKNVTADLGGQAQENLDFSGGFIDLNRSDAFESDHLGIDQDLPNIDPNQSATQGFAAATAALQAHTGEADQDKLSWMQFITAIREYDVKYFVRVAIDLNIFVGKFYKVTVEQGETIIGQLDQSKYVPPWPRVCAFDIETTKGALKFPQPERDEIFMISYMCDGQGFLIVNRDIVSEDITGFEYKPKDEYAGEFTIYNVPDEVALLRKWYSHMQEFCPMVYVTYNGDYFDFPFMQARSEIHGMDLRKELGFSPSNDGAMLNPRVAHLDCFYWVKRDSYLPQGSHGLKAVTKAKLGYDPVEVDPEEMLPLAQSHPQRMASYSVSDAVATYYLYKKYVHPFIFSLCTIIPCPPDNVLRNGSGTLCESLLMVQAYAKNVVFPNKQVTQREKFFNGHLIDSETYIGGRVEALRSGVYRSTIPLQYHCTPEVIQKHLIDKLDDQLKFAIEVEGNMSMDDITNYQEVRTKILTKLEDIRDNPIRKETPLIYHVDVAAMYPNIILTNRLQPPSMVTEDVCANCCFNTPDNANKCKRDMKWVWKGEMFTAGKHEFHSVKAQLEREAIAEEAIKKADAAATTKKTYGNRKGSVLEGTKFDKGRGGGFGGRGFGGEQGGGGGGGYRKMSNQQRQAEREALLPTINEGSDNDKGSGGSESDEDGLTKFQNLTENTQHALLKKRLGEYSRKAYRKVHETRIVERINTVCQRENGFYVDTVRLFRDRRYEYKNGLKEWKGKLAKAKENNEPISVIRVAEGKCVQMESLQLAHKCILNSFYGYVMRKGSRWYSMEMAGIVTCLGASLIKMARELVEHLGVTLELDTDGIWCCLPKSFPENFTFETKNPKKKLPISYPCLMMNKDVHDRYTNHQYQDLVVQEVRKEAADVDAQAPAAPQQQVYSTRSECSIYFEVDGPYAAMILPASREEGKSIKKRYAVFHPDGSLAELKGFELKRRGELMLIKEFQSQVFKKFLNGTSLQEAYASAAEVADNALDILYTKGGGGYEEEEVLAKLTESSNMTRRLSEYPENQKSLALTTARRIADFLGPDMVKDKGLQCAFVISRLPHGKTVTERAVPISIFKAEPAVRIEYLRRWTGDMSIVADTKLRDLLDWDYYITRINNCVQKIITIPAALQQVANPVPRVKHPDWLSKVVASRNARFKQVSLDHFKVKTAAAVAKAKDALGDLEDLGLSLRDSVSKKRKNHDGSASEHTHDSEEIEGENDEDDSVQDLEEAAERLRVDTERKEREHRLVEFKKEYFAPKSTKDFDASVFKSEPFTDWLTDAKSRWTQRAKVRREILGNQNPNSRSTVGHKSGLPVAQNLSAGFIEAKTKALGHPWHILEIRENPSSNVVALFVMLDNELHTFYCPIDRRILIDFKGGAVTSEVINAVFGTKYGFHVKPAPGRALPRHRSSVNLMEFDLSLLSPKEDMQEFLAHLNAHPYVNHIYEAELSSVDRTIAGLGCVANVNKHRHLNRRSALGGSARIAHAFQIQDLDAVPARRSYLDQVPLSRAFVYYLPDPTATAANPRALIAAIVESTGEALLSFVQPGAAERRITERMLNDNEQKYLRDIAEEVRLVCRAKLRFSVRYSADLSTGCGHVETLLSDALTRVGGQALHMVVLQSTVPASNLSVSGMIPSLGQLPVMTIAGAQEDETSFSNVLMWLNAVTKRMMQRYLASEYWMTECLMQSRVGGVPLCNHHVDSFIGTLDRMFLRVLRSHGHVVWDRRDGEIFGDEVEERKVSAASASGNIAWCIEVPIERIEVVAILFSQTITENDDPIAVSLTERSISSSQFNLLRDVVSELFHLAAQSNESAMGLLLNVPRWIRSPSSLLYEPAILSTVNSLVSRTLLGLVKRVQEIGGRIIAASKTSITVSTQKHSLPDALRFTQYLFESLKRSKMLRHLVPAASQFHLGGDKSATGGDDGRSPTRTDASTTSNLLIGKLWSSLLIQDQANYFGTFYQLNAFGIENPTGPLQAEVHLEALQEFSPQMRELFAKRVHEVLTAIQRCKTTAEEKVNNDKSVTLATHNERFIAATLDLLVDWTQNQFQLSALSDVGTIKGLHADQLLQHQQYYYVPYEKSRGSIQKSGTTAAVAAAADDDQKWHVYGASAAARYAAMLTHFVALLPQVVAHVAQQTRYNCLRQADMPVEASYWDVSLPPSTMSCWDATSTTAASVTLCRITCAHCNTDIAVDLVAPDILHDAQVQQIPSMWRCPACHDVFLSSDAIESQMVSQVHRLCSQLEQQDFVCGLCSKASGSVVLRKCSCGGRMQGSLTKYRNRVTDALKLLAKVSAKNGLNWLHDAAEDGARVFAN